MSDVDRKFAAVAVDKFGEYVFLGSIPYSARDFASPGECCVFDTVQDAEAVAVTYALKHPAHVVRICEVAVLYTVVREKSGMRRVDVKSMP